MLFAADDGQTTTKKIFTEELDAMLVNARQRDALRQSLGHVEPVPSGIEIGTADTTDSA